VDICNAGDAFISEATSKIYNKKGTKVEKGIAFPTCVSPNNIVGHYSPLPAKVKAEPKAESGEKAKPAKDAKPGDVDAELKAGDVVKLDLGVHIDGYVAFVAHTVVLNEGPVTGRAADVIAACYTAADCVLRLLKPGTKNSQVTEVLGKVAADYKCQPVAGVLSHQMTKFVIDGKKVIINKTDVEQKVDEIEFEQNEVWAIDIVMSTGEGKTKESEHRTTVYKRAVETNYALKMKASRAVLSEINKVAPTFPFTIRRLEEKTARMGIVECFSHGLVSSYPVLTEKEGEIVAHLKFTALMLPSGTVPITGLLTGADRTRVTSEHKAGDEVTAVLKQAAATASSAAAKKKKKKKAAGGAAAKKEGDAPKKAPATAAPAGAASGAGGAAKEEGKAKKAAKKKGEAAKEAPKAAAPAKSEAAAPAATPSPAKAAAADAKKAADVAASPAKAAAAVAAVAPAAPSTAPAGASSPAAPAKVATAAKTEAAPPGGPKIEAQVAASPKSADVASPKGKKGKKA